MSAPVDVLAVMGIAATTLHADNYSGTANSMDAARAAVAELIDFAESALAYVDAAAADEKQRHRANGAHDSLVVAQVVADQLRNNLARVRGGAA